MLGNLQMLINHKALNSNTLHRMKGELVKLWLGYFCEK